MTSLPQSSGCFVCGADNPYGLRLVFIRDEAGVFTEFVPEARHCGYPGVLHGGIVASLLDETLGWAASVVKRRYFLTADLRVRYRRPVLAGTRVRVNGRYLGDKAGFWRAEGEVVDATGVVYASATGLYTSAPDEAHERFLRETQARYSPERVDPFGDIPGSNY
ncbi:MAG: hypothetical protein AMXMBFR61_11230 [Fimbriimonadales bacterium]